MSRSSEEESALAKDVYFTGAYAEFDSLAPILEQIVAVSKFGAKSLLEIGVGNGMLSSHFRRKGLAVTTVDINANLQPDIVGSVLELASLLPGETFEAIVCCEVLEHIPFAHIPEVLDQLADCCARRALISLPVAVKSGLNFVVRGQLLGKRFHWAPTITRRKKTISDAHHWEINHAPQTAYAKVAGLLEKRFRIIENVRSDYCPYQQFFILEKS